MSTLTFLNVSGLLTRNGDDLQLKKSLMLERVNNYLAKSLQKNSLTTSKIENDELTISIPQCKFTTFTESKLVFHDNHLLNETTFFVEKDGKRHPFHKIYLDTENTAHFSTPTRDPSVDLDYARHFEEAFLNELIQAAFKDGLLKSTPVISN